MVPPPLDLKKTYSYSDMLLSSRTSPRLSLRKSGYDPNDRGPLSSSSSRFSFNHLIKSPPPSPSLPALVPRHGKPAPSRTPRKCFRGFLWFCGIAMILYFCSNSPWLERPMTAVGWATDSGNHYEMVGESELPDFPTPVIVTDKRGRSKWTVSIPPNHEFPLTPTQYADICSQNMEVAATVADLHSHVHREHTAHYDYYHVDQNFMDVAEAEAHGLLPGIKTKNSVKDGVLVGEKKGDLIDSDICDKTLTFVLETSDAGLGKTLMMLWTAFGLAQKEGRHFFVDDSRWAYGKYTTFFQAPPAPKCRPPPRHEMLPCPHHARHLVVSAATVTHTFGGSFNDYFEDARKMEVYRQKPIFEMARLGYTALFNLSDGDNEYVDRRAAEFRAKTTLDPVDQESGIVVGVHVRHGDRRPFEFQYKDSYIPLTVYSDTARMLLDKKYNHSLPNGGHDTLAQMASAIVLASDDPDVYDSDEFKDVSRAQEQIRLASKNALEAATPQPNTPGPRKFVDDTVGWEGGFYAGMFWSLGKPSGTPKTAVENPETALTPTTEALRLRELVGRAYLMDLTVLGKASDKIVCTVSSTGCRILAVMMGWEKAIDQGGFVNVDGNFDWRGIAW
ncbi:ef2b15d3-9fb4-4248-b272-00d5474fac15 [Sclerotinia trifoliorum]|uniref:Ef2b15d3-9fb4-4248-b272-00d5474fac15 n=1 Tax=Sclerotinia trifoliorum TaxID=28548 RepID=A0A8H2VN60_9HELO|nr:ef2b15d3-9fb4-4248-b272-00d5474fac15 [Sclerotinia trifoliorum]